jgi:hypothetical protein
VGVAGKSSLAGIFDLVPKFRGGRPEIRRPSSANNVGHSLT